MLVDMRERFKWNQVMTDFIFFQTDTKKCQHSLDTFLVVT